MVTAATTTKRKAPAKKKRAKRPSPTLTAKIKKAGEPVPPKGMMGQMTSMAGRMLDVGANTIGVARTLKSASVVAKALRGGHPLEAASEVLKAVLPSGENNPGALAKTGAALRGMREAAGLTIDEVGAAINLKDPAVIEALESGVIALPFELILRLAAVLGRNDPIGFVMEFTRASNPEIWRLLEVLGFGKLLIQGAREREFANIYRGSDEARKLDDTEFASLLAFTRSAFELALTFRQQQQKDK